MAKQKLQGYPGIYIEYEEGKNPYFQLIVIEALGLIKATATGKRLLSEISRATPSSRPEGLPSECNVLIVPSVERVLIQSGYQRYGGSLVKNPDAPPAKFPFYLSGLSGTCHNAYDQTGACRGGGSAVEIRFNNTEMLATDSVPFIILAHELVHAYHALTGKKKDGEDEELWTTGIGDFSNEAICENAIRKEAGLPVRESYY